MKFPELSKMRGTQVSILLSKRIYAFVTGFLVHDRCKCIMKKIDDSDVIVHFNENIACDYKFSACMKWLLIECSRHVANGDKYLEAKMRRDATSIAPIDAG